MKLFDILAGKVVIHNDALGIPAFKKVWDADKADKEMDTKYISYIVLKNKYDSSCFNLGSILSLSILWT